MIHKEKDDKQKEMNEFKQELSRTSASYNINRKKIVFKHTNNFLKVKGDFLSLQEEVIEKLQNCYDYLESSINKEKNITSSTRKIKISNILIKYNDELLQLKFKLNENYYSLKNIVQENKELEIILIIENILKLNSFNFDRYKIFKFTTNSQKETRIQLNSNMMAEDINLLKKNLDELKLELKQEKEELKNLAAV
ncbi:unnamed protein product [Rhizophagus irregularis]|nr:unnamed protein product [Rhizophagus irregularis]